MSSKIEASSAEVIIIGAGVAGLAAAELLSKYDGLNVTILEASNRFGGRIFTTELSNGEKLELGAHYIHGTQNNPIYELAKEKKIRMKNGIEWYDKNYQYLTESGKYIPKSTAIKSMKFLEKMIDACCEKENLTNIPSDICSVGDFIRWKLHEKLATIRDSNEKSLRASAFLCREVLEASISGCSSLRELHLKDFGEYNELNDVDKEILDGYETIVEKIVKELPLNIIHYDNRVHKVVWDYEDDTSNTSDHRITVNCTAGQVYKADFVICTVSLGVLKAEARDWFIPSLDTEKLQVIDRMGFGISDKIYLRYAKPFWKGNRLVYYFLWNDKDYMIADDRCLPIAEDEKWLRGIMAFETVPHCADTIVIWLCGENAKIMENLSEKTIAKSITRLLQAYTGIADLPEPEAVYRTQWFVSPAYRGSYSYVSVDSCGNDIDILAQPILNSKGKPVLFFAGEATHRKYYSTTHGAYLSGQREANRIVNIKFNSA